MAVPEKSTAAVLFCGRGFRSALAADNMRKISYTKFISKDCCWLQVQIKIVGIINGN
jgi:hypothetical protein